MKSYFFNAWVSHKRFSPKEHEFSYKVPVFSFDLAELEKGMLDGPLFRRKICEKSTAKPGAFLPRILCFKEDDYLYRGPFGLRKKLAQALIAGDIDPAFAQNEVRLITSCRFMGYGFNPVSFWMIYKQDNPGELILVIAEVNNTFGEKHLYPLQNENHHPFPVKFYANKEFHVSPFNDMRGVYKFRFTDPREDLDIQINLIKNDQTLLEAKLWCDEKGKPVTTKTLANTLFHPYRVLTYPRILRQASKLYLKRKLKVYTKPKPESPLTIRHAENKESKIDSMAKSLIMRRLARFKTGNLAVLSPYGEISEIKGDKKGYEADIKIKKNDFYRMLLFRGALGLGEAYEKGFWETSDLETLFAFFLSNEEKRYKRQRPNIITKYLEKFFIHGKPEAPGNSISGSKKNITAHYDLSNRAFSLFLDSTMTYSCALFKDPFDPQETMEQAQTNKLRLIAQKAGIQDGDHVLEIGCGWGGFALLAAKEFNCRVSALTLSQKQFDYVRDLVKRSGLTSKVKPILGDYRKLKEKYQAIVSIEMIEAVGHKYHKAYFKTLDRLLAPQGKAVIQAITIVDQRYDAYRQNPDWISTYIFPGGLLPSLNRISTMVTKHTSLVISDVQDIGKHYTPTLAWWRSRFLKNWSAIKELGFDESFKKRFEYYFSICQAGFTFGHIRNVQIVFERPEYHKY